MTSANDVSLEYFNKKKKDEKHKADSELRKGFYNAEKYHGLQEITNILVIVYFIVAIFYGGFFIYRGAYKNQKITSMLFNVFMIIILPYFFYYYLVDFGLYIFNYITKFVTSLSVNNLIAFVFTIFIALFILTSIFVTPFIASITPIIITFSAFIVIFGIILRSSFLA